MSFIIILISYSDVVPELVFPYFQKFIPKLNCDRIIGWSNHIVNFERAVISVG